MSRRRNWIVMMCFFLMVMTLAGCSEIEEQSVVKEEYVETVQETEEKEEMVVAVSKEETTQGGVFGNVLMNRSKFWGSLVFQGLLIADENINNVRKDLCEEYSISSDGKTYTFVLKSNLYWHDGERLTAEDLVWTIETCLRSKEVNEHVLKGLKRIAGVEQFVSEQKNSISGISVDGDSVTIEIQKQDNSFLSALAQMPVLPKHCLKDIPIEELGTCEFWKHPIGSGPYKIIETKENQEVLLAINDKYSGKRPKIERIRYRFLEKTLTDDFTFAITSEPSVVEKFQKNSSYKVVKTGNLNYCYLYCNLDGRNKEESERIQNRKVRQALAIGIDRKRIAEDIYKGVAVIIEGGIPETDSWYLEKEEEKVAYNPELAKKMLIQSEFDFSKPLVLAHYNQDELTIRLLKTIKECWEKLGIKVEIQSVDAQNMDTLWEKPDWYDIGLKYLTAADYSDWYYEYSSNNELWSEVYKNRTIFDVLILTLKETKWAYERTMLYHEIQSMEAEELYKIPLVLVPQYVIYNEQELYIPAMEFPNMEYYYDLKLSQWELLSE